MPSFKKRTYDSDESEELGDGEVQPGVAAKHSVPRSRSGRRIKPKKWDDDTTLCLAEEGKPAKEADTDSCSDDHYSPDKRLPEAAFAVPAAKARHAHSSELRESVPVRDQAGRFAGMRRRSAGEPVLNESVTGSRGGGIFKTAAIQVLRQEGRLMSTGEIAKVALKSNYINVQGKTPEATMASALYTDIKRKEGHSVFIRPHEGLFGLREWLEAGHTFADPAERVHRVFTPRPQQPAKPVPVFAHQRPTLTLPESRNSRSQLRGIDGRFRTSLAGQVTATRSWSEPADSAFVRAPIRPAPRQYSTNLDMLFAAVDEVSGASGGDDKAERASSAELDEEVGKAESATADVAAPLQQSHSAAASSAILHKAAAQVVSATKESKGTTAVADPVLNVAAQIVLSASNDFLAKLMHVHNLEVALKSMEEELGTNDPKLGSAYLQMFKLYHEAGLQEKAHNALQRAYEVSEAAAAAAGAAL